MWLEMVSRNVTGERARQRGKGPAQQKRGPWRLRERGMAVWAVGIAREGIFVMEATGPGDQQDAGELKERIPWF